MKRIMITTVLISGLMLPVAAFAQTTTVPSTTITAGEPSRTVSVEPSVTGTLKTKYRTTTETLKKQITPLVASVGRLTNAEVTEIKAPMVTVTSEGKSISITTTASTKFLRHFWGTAVFADIAVGDKVSVIGKWTDDTHTAMTALLVRDTSNMKRAGVFLGTVSSLSGDTFVLTTEKKGTPTVTVTTKTRFINRKDVSMNKSDLKAADKVRVRGVWDQTQNTIKEVMEVKDFSVPTPTASTSSTPHPTE